MPQAALKTIAEAGAGAGTAVIAGGAFSPAACDTPTISEYPLLFLGQYAVTIDDVLRGLAGVATIITIAYFINKFTTKPLQE